jgi:hypothetical protein
VFTNNKNDGMENNIAVIQRELAYQTARMDGFGKILTALLEYLGADVVETAELRQKALWHGGVETEAVKGFKVVKRAKKA